MKTRLHEMVAMAPEGDGGAAPAPDGGAGAGAEPAPAPAPVASAPAEVARPDYLPENYWDAETKAPKLDTLVSDFSAAKIKAQQLDERLAQVPADPSGYKLVLPEGIEAPAELGDFEIPADSVLAKLAPEIAHKHGASQALISDLLGALAQDQISAHVAQQAAMAEDMKLLGERGPDRIKTVESFLKSKLSADEYAGIQGAITTSAGVIGLEKLIASTGGLAAIPGGGSPAGSRPDLSGMTAEQKLHFANEQAAAKSATK